MSVVMKLQENEPKLKPMLKVELHVQEDMMDKYKAYIHSSKLVGDVRSIFFDDPIMIEVVLFDNIFDPYEYTIDEVTLLKKMNKKDVNGNELWQGDIIRDNIIEIEGIIMNDGNCFNMDDFYSFDLRDDVTRIKSYYER
jgi:hypothetical protein